MGILIWIIFGAIAGWIASAIVGNSEGLVMDIIVGIVGAMIGGWVMTFFGYGGVSGFNFYSLFVAILGAVILLSIVNALRKT